MNVIFYGRFCYEHLKTKLKPKESSLCKPKIRTVKETFYQIQLTYFHFTTESFSFGINPFMPDSSKDKFPLQSVTLCSQADK